MEGKRRSKVSTNSLGYQAPNMDQFSSYSIDKLEWGCLTPPSLLSADSPTNNPFRFPPPPSLVAASRISSNRPFYENGESDNSLTTGSASDVEDNSDSQSDATGLTCSSIMLRNDHGSHCRTSLQKESGSQSDTGFGGVSGSCNIKMRSSPVPIHRPLYSIRGYESDGSPVGIRSQANFLPPIGVFWDIENCQVPKGRSAVAVAQLIREKFFEGRREAEFLVVCDVKKENAQIVSELNDAQVNLIHVAATCKNAADEKLRQSIRRFAEIYGSPAAIILISGDVNFAADLNDLRHRKKIHVILIHNSNTSETLILCANEHYDFSSLVENLPLRGAFKSGNQPVEVVVSNLPPDKDIGKVKNRLRKLSDNCGGRVGNIAHDRAIIRFPTVEFASRAQKRMDGQDVLGNKILVSRPQRVFVNDQESVLRPFQDRPRVRRTTQRSIEDLKISNLPSSVDFPALHQHSLFGVQPKFGQGMYLSKGYGHGSKSEHPASSMVSSASLPSSSQASVPLSSANLPALGINQTGIGTASFYRNTPPPRIILGNVAPASPGTSHTYSQSLINGFNHGNSSSFLSSSSQSVAPETLPTVYAKAARTLQQQQQFQLSQSRWQGAPSNSNGKGNASSLQMASESLSLLTSNLPSSGTGDIAPDLWKHVNESSALPGESAIWGESASVLQAPHVSPLRGCIAPQTRTPSPSALASVSAQTHAQAGHSRAGAGDGLQWTNQVCSNGVSKTVVKSRTPSPYNLHVDQMYRSQGNRRTWGNASKTSPVMDVKEPDRFFNPINNVQGRQNQGNNGPVELQVTNLDQNMEPKEMKRLLQAVFREHVSVLNVSVFVQSDGNLAATVKVPSLQDAQYAISQLHRKKIGFKRIQISYSQNGPTINPALVRSQIVSLLQDVPGHRLPLFKFREMFENRYLTTISVSDMYKLRDVCLVSEEPIGRMVSLNPQHRNTPSPLLAGTTQDGQSAMELPYCPQHYQKQNTQDKGWAEQELATLPNVNVGLKVFTQRVQGLLRSHSGSLPLPSFAYCYGAQFGPLEVDENGVPLEHLVSCVPGVELYQGVGCVKYLRWLSGSENEVSNDTDGSSVVSNVSPPLAGPLALFSRELVDLLKTAPNCQISFNRFIPAYHHHFGRQCRVADYGYTKLMPLLEALSNIVQVLGEGNKRMVTLSHRAQVRRFTSDLLRVLKAQYSKQVTLSEFSAAYQRVLNRPFEVVNYGVCLVDDLLAEVAETTVLVSPIPNSSDVLIAIPKREQTPEEMEKTKQFASEVLQLLRYAPQCSMDFSKFIPYYHHHFGKQCRVSDYGFSKLVELFEAIPDVVKVTEGEEGERRVQLTLDQRLRVLGDIVASIVQEYEHTYMPLSAVSENFLLSSGYALRPEDYGFNSLEELFSVINFSVQLHCTQSGVFVGLVDQNHLHSINMKIRYLLWAHEDCCMVASDFEVLYSEIVGGKCNFEDIQRDLKDIIEVTKDESGAIQFISLKPLQVFARDVCQLLQESGGRFPFSTFETAYIQHFGKAIQPAQYGFSSVPVLLQALHDIVSIKGKGQRRLLVLNDDVNNVSWPEGTKASQETTLCNQISSSPKKTISAEDSSMVAESPDTVLKKLIRNLSNQPSPAKQRLFGERTSGGSQGYRPLGFATSQQPLHTSSNHHFAWGPSHQLNSGYSSFTVPISIPPCSLDSPTALMSSGFNGMESSSPPNSRASLPVVQPPHPSELPMPQMVLKSPTTQLGVDNVGGNSILITGRLGNQEDMSANTSVNSNSDATEQAVEAHQDGALNLSQDGNAGRSKRKQRLAIQFTSPLVPI